MEINPFLSTLYFLPVVAAAKLRFAHHNDQLVKPHEHGISHINRRTEGLARNPPHTNHHVRGTNPSPFHANVGPDLLALIERAVEIEHRWKRMLHLLCSISSVMGSFCLFSLSLWQTSKLFSQVRSLSISPKFEQGLWNQKFFKGGGYWLLTGAGCGAILGACLSFALDPFYTCYFMSGFMLLGASVVYIGRRGAILGTTGGMVVGLTLGVIHSGSISASIVEGILCMFSGIAIGFVPIFPSLKINTRYIQQGLRSTALATQ